MEEGWRECGMATWGQEGAFHSHWNLYMWMMEWVTWSYDHDGCDYSSIYTQDLCISLYELFFSFFKYEKCHTIMKALVVIIYSTWQALNSKCKMDVYNIWHCRYSMIEYFYEYLFILQVLHYRHCPYSPLLWRWKHLVFLKIITGPPSLGYLSLLRGTLHKFYMALFYYILLQRFKFYNEAIKHDLDILSFMFFRDVYTILTSVTFSILVLCFPQNLISVL